jgi:uncharacterized protein YkwD
MPLRPLAAASASSAALLLLPGAAASAHPTARHDGLRASACRDANVRTTAAPRAAIKAAVVCLVNQERRRYGLPAVRVNQDLNRSAQGWSDAMVATSDFQDGPWTSRIAVVGIRFSTAGENIATGFATPNQVVSGWMGSPGHCRNILDPNFALVGTGVVDRVVGRSHGGRATWTQDFATRLGRRDPSDNWGPADAVCR